MKTHNGYEATFPTAQQIGGPLSLEQVWRGVMRMSQFSHTVFSEIEQSVYQGVTTATALGLQYRVATPAIDSAAVVEQNAGKIISSVA